MQPFERDFGWQRRLLPHVKRAIADHLIIEAPFEDDARRNTDLIVLRAEAVRIACRLRRHEYVSQYGDEFTIRVSRPSGADTELAKVLSGWGDYLFYGFATPEQDNLSAWLLGDLREFRLWHHRVLAGLAGSPAGKIPGTGRQNGDRSSTFHAYRITDLPAKFVVARKVYQALAVA